jgi:hypothetical protein
MLEDKTRRYQKIGMQEMPEDEPDDARRLWRISDDIIF